MIEYITLPECNSDELISILNSEDVRVHLMPHTQFNHESLANWIKQKSACDALAGCRVRGILIDKQLAGWCGIQDDPLGYEIGIILAKPFWGCGKIIFKEILGWAKEFGHDELIIHFHESRPSYKFLSKLTDNKVTQSVILGNKFNTYHIPVRANIKL